MLSFFVALKSLFREQIRHGSKLPSRLLREKPSVTQREGEPLPEPLHVLIQRVLEAPPSVSI